MRVKPLAVFPAPGESKKDCVNAVIAFDNWLSEQLKEGNFIEVQRPDGTIDIVRP